LAFSVIVLLSPKIMAPPTLVPVMLIDEWSYNVIALLSP